jgi:hypothetical protein
VVVSKGPGWLGWRGICWCDAYTAGMRPPQAVPVACRLDKPHTMQTSSTCVCFSTGPRTLLLSGGPLVLLTLRPQWVFACSWPCCNCCVHAKVALQKVIGWQSQAEVIAAAITPQSCHRMLTAWRLAAASGWCSRCRQLLGAARTVTCLVFNDG